MPVAEVTTIDTHYADRSAVAAAYLIEADGEVAFIETNTNAAIPRLLAALDARALSPAQVRFVIVTHIHLDHAGGAGALMAVCPNATLLAHPRAAPHAIDPTRIIAGAREVYGDTLFDQLYGEIIPIDAARVRELGDGELVELGRRPLRFVHTRGHANHHFCVHDPLAEAVFTGDAFGLLYPHLQRNGTLALASTTPTDFDADAAIDSLERVLATGATRVFPTHFGEHRDLSEAAGQLRRQLDGYAKIVDEADHSGRADAELDAFCFERTRSLVVAELERVSLAGDAEALSLLEADIRLNAAGISFAVRKLRYKRR